MIVDPAEYAARVVDMRRSAAEFEAELRHDYGEQPDRDFPVMEVNLPRELERMHIPTKYRESTLGNFDITHDWQPKKRAEEFLEAWPPARPMMLFSGTVGNGKTHLACAVLRAAFEKHGRRGQFWKVISLLDRYKATFSDDEATETVEQVDAQLRRCEVLVLDDLGAENSKEWAAERVFRLVDERYSEGLPLIITSNVAVNDLPERVRSRMKSGVMAYFGGPDRRAELRR